MIERTPQDPLGLAGKTQEELLALATEAGIRGGRRLSREELLRKLTEARRSPPEPAAPAVSEPPGKASLPLSMPEGMSDATPPPNLPTELPPVYGMTRLTLMEVDPFHLFAYWEITPQDREWALKHAPASPGSTSWVLRLYDVSCIEFDGTNAHGSFDVPIDPTSASWYINLWSDEKTYLAELGIRSADGQFVAICRSNFVQTPRSSSSPRYQPCWMRVDYDSTSGTCVNPAPHASSVGSENVSTHADAPAASSPAASPAPPQGSLSLVPQQVQLPESTVHSDRGSDSRSRDMGTLGQDAEENARLTPLEHPEDDPLLEEMDAAIARTENPRDPAEEVLPTSGGFSSVATEISTLLRRSESLSQPVQQAANLRDAGDLVQLSQTSALSTPVTHTLDNEGLKAEMPAQLVTDEHVRAHYSRPLTPVGQPSPGNEGTPPFASDNRSHSPHEGSMPPDSSSPPADRGAGHPSPPRLPPGGPSSYGLSSGLSGAKDGPSLSLQLGCEVIVHGRALPGQTLEVNGHWVKVNPDGTFRVQWALSTT